MILVTGATGFVGGALIKRLALERSFNSVVAVVRKKTDVLPKSVRQVQVGDLSAATNWNTALTGIDVIVHCAARVHVIQNDVTDHLEAYREVNVRATLNLARQAASAGVSRFVFVSSIKVNGEETQSCKPFTADSVTTPSDSYSASKLEAEEGLRKIAAMTGMDVVIVRPPLIYGPGVKANFASMMRWLARGVPIPLAAVTYNRRSLIGIDNLVEFIEICLFHPAAANQIFLVSDGEDLSTAELLKRMGNAMGNPARLIYIPPKLLNLGASILRKGVMYQKLCGSLQLDITKTRQLLVWAPSVSVDEGLRRAVRGIRI